MRTQFILLLMIVVISARAQDGRPWEQYLSEVMISEDSESSAWERTCELLCELEQHPLDLNAADREQLEELPFLTAQQIEELIEYQYRYGPMKSTGELLMIRSLDETRRKLLTYFIFINDEKESHQPSLKDIAKYGRHELTTTLRVPLYERKGDKEGYLGNPYRHWVRYQFTYGDYVKLGVVGSQDAGEPFFKGQNKWGYDYYSPYLQIRNIGHLESLLLGNFRVSMGMGLVMNNSFGLGKISMLQNMGRSTNTIRAHSSRSDNYLQGAAISIRASRHLHTTAFLSYGAMDATLNPDETARTILTSGYHRTETEMEKKHNLHALKTGGSLRYETNGLHLSMNTVYVHLDRMLKPETSALYRKNYPRGKDFWNTSADYGFVRHRVALNGETAIDKKGHIATINTLSVRLSDVLNAMLLQRFYSYSYASLDAQSYSDGDRVQNESGVYLGITWQPSPKFRLTTYADYAYFAWAKYMVSQTSWSWDQLLQATYTGKKWNFGIRYRLRMKQKDDEKKTSLVNRWEHRGRLSVEYASDGGFGCRTQFDGGYCAYGNGEWGSMLSESLLYTHNWLRLNAGAGYFHTDGYDSRVYLYERGPLYTYSIAQFYGEGIRYWLMARAKIGRNLSLTAKIGITDYFDRGRIGSGYQEIDGSSQTDLDFQLRWIL